MFKPMTMVTLIALLSGCGSRAYVIPPQEAKRAAEALARGEQAVLLALDEEEFPVPIEVRPDDWFEVTSKLTSGGQGTWLEAGQLGLVNDSVEHLTLYHRNLGPTLVGIGAGMLGGSWLICTIAAGTDGPGTLAIPLVGPILMMHDAAQKQQACEDRNGLLCDLTGVGVAAGLILFLAQAAGTGLLIGGAAAWDDGREIHLRDEDGQSALRFSVEPVVLGQGGLGGMLTGRF
jgi:hypothetical protein